MPARRPAPAYFLPVVLALVVVGAAAFGAEVEQPPKARRAYAQRAPVTPVLSARRAPGLLAAPVANRRLTAKLTEFLGATPGPTCLTVAADGVGVFSSNPTAPVTPASLEKLLTATTALDKLGPDTKLVTTVRAATAPAGGVVGGDLYLVGGGDPLLMTADYVASQKYPIAEHSSLEQLADAVVAAGVKTVNGRVVGDETRYDTVRYNPRWSAVIANEVDIGPMSALTVNYGLDAYPPAPDLRSPAPHASPDPAATAADRLAGLLRERGVTIAGAAATGAAPAGAIEIAHLDSAPVSALVGEMLRESDNTTAELLTKELGARTTGGTTDAGVAVINDEAVADHLAVDGTGRIDGSGLATDDKVTCAFVQQLLDGSGATGPLGAGLPIAGQSGTLRKRFLATPVIGRLHAKTGTLDRVTALAGFLPTARGANITFTYVLNLDAPQRVTNDDVALQDDLVTILDSYPDAPDQAALGPKPVP